MELSGRLDFTEERSKFWRRHTTKNYSSIEEVHLIFYNISEREFHEANSRVQE